MKACDVDHLARLEAAEERGFGAVLHWRAEHQGERTAFVYLADGEDEADRLTFAALDERARSLAAWLQQHELVGKRIILLYRAGLEFIVGFLGCLYAGAVAVPAYPPHVRRPDPRLQSILDDCNPDAAFCLLDDCERLSRTVAHRGLKIVATDALADQAHRWTEPRIGLDSLAHLQYTSGSTDHPKGVMISHGNLLHQVAYLTAQMNCSERTVNVTWQPFFHDMGLVGSVLTSIFCGAVTYVMAPEAFLRSPIRWLRAISKYHGTSGPAPNFAYDLCVTRTTPAQREGLDLGTWESAWNGAEPVRAATVDRFCEIYEPYGFRRRAFIPCYGMAETTLSTTMDRPDRVPVIATFSRDALERNRAVPCPPDDASAVRLVSSGVVAGGMELAIVNAETGVGCTDGTTGEIWVSGPSVAQGYWQRPDETERTFNAHLDGKNEKRYLRTGDLGFVSHGELFVTGRLKDLIIIRGRNVYPQDVELVAQQSHEALQPDGCAAFSLEIDGREELALALEVKRTQRHRLDPDEVFGAVRAAIGEHFGVAVHWLGLVQPGRVPKTSSGKVMRSESRRECMSGDLSLLAEWRSHTEDYREEGSPPEIGLVERLLSLPQSERHPVLVAHLQSEIARALQLRGLPDPTMGFERLGVDSMGAVELVNRVQDQLGKKVSLPTTLLFDQPNIDAVARYVEQSLFGERHQTAAVVPDDRPPEEPVAIVGLACRFPGAPNGDEFWQLLDEGRDAIREVPDNRWDIEDYFDPDPSAVGKMNTRFGGFIDDIEGFDAPFFDISPREAASMDPQHRHLLEVSWLALEDAGIAPARIDGRPIGVFVGISTSDYEKVLAGRGPEAADAFMATGNAHSAAVGRLSFALGFRGPCVAIDTACSSSLVAVHEAAQSLRHGECELALAGGVNAILRPEVTVAFSKARLLSPDGRCKTFDATADGYVRSEGCGMVVLKRLTEAKRDGDRILALIRGSAINQDGRSSGLTAPNGPSQTQVIANALAEAKVDPACVQYLECHGTATVLGDPIEVQAANAILSRGRSADEPLVIGSVKSNVGHLEAAAGIAGLIKVVLALQHETIPRSLHFRTPNPHIPWASMPVRVAAERLPWKSTYSRTRIAGVSSFGFAGTNAHVIIEEPPREQAEVTGKSTEGDDAPRLLAISARSARALQDVVARYAAWLRTRGGASLSDVCHTANTGRNHLEHRAVVICESREGVTQKLEAAARGESSAGTIKGVAPRQHRPRVAFLFPGQGLQYAGMARELYECAPAFRDCLDRCAEAYEAFGREDGSPPLKVVMFDSSSMERLKQTRYVQPALYALQVSLAALWRSWGVEPDTVLGHSAGEYAAACIAGVFRVEDGLRLIVERARLMQSLPSGGTMLSVTAPVDTIEAAIAGEASVQVSAYNGLNTVISGPIDRLDALMAQFDEQELYCSKLPASNAFHSPSVEPILDEFEGRARAIEFRAPTGRLISTMTGKPVDAGEVPDAAYWRRQARQPVRFAQAVRTLFEDVGCDVGVELGPQAELIWLAQMSWRPDHKVLWASSLAKGRNAYQQMLTSAAQLHANGVTLDFRGMETQPCRKIALPSYPFQHERYWPGPMGGNVASALQDCLYELRWQPSETPSLRPARPQNQNWLILANDTELGAALETELRARGQSSLIRDQKGGDTNSLDAVRAILESARRHGHVDHVVLIAAPIADAIPDGETVRSAQSLGVTSALRLAQALISTREATRLWLVTRGVHAVLDNEAVDPTHSPMWGFGRTFAAEHPDRYGGLIDLPLQEECSKTAAELASVLLRDDDENQVALRDGKSWVARLQRHAMRNNFPLRLRADATYLITGGTGALGLMLARHMAERGARHIALTSRSGGSDSARAAIQALADSGCRVDVYRADVSVRAEAEQLIEQVMAAAAGHPLRGIVHAAGVLDGAPVATHTPELLASVMAPKVWGAWNLHQATRARDIELDIFALFSSAASLLGLRGHSNYGAANAYLDSLAQHRRNLGLPAVAINWGPWADEGMATRVEAGRWEEIGTRLIRPRLALRAFDHFANGEATQICVQPMNLSRWSDLAQSGRLPPILLKFLEALLSLANTEAATAGDSGKRIAKRGAGELVHRLAALAPAERRRALETHLRERVGRVVGLSAGNVDPDAGFFDMGMNSIMAVELRSALQADIGDTVDLQAAVIFNHPTVRKIAAYLWNALYPKDERDPVPVRVLDSSEAQASALRCEASGLAQAIDSAAGEVLGPQHWPAELDDREEDKCKRKALAAILSLQSEVHRLQSRAVDPVAVIGLSCRYPGAADPEAFWRILDEGRDEITEVPADRWDVSAHYDVDPDAPGKMNSRYGGFVSGIDMFDAGFFGISPREAMSLDPQQRILLEVSWEALENAGLAPRRLRGARGGVFVGISVSDYAERLSRHGIEQVDAYGGTGNALCAAAGRLAFTLGWEGPALAIDTACSSSVVSLHEACTSLRAGECDIALAGGVNVLLNPSVSLILAKSHMLSSEGRCKTFDAAANGYVRSEGCGMVVLKRLGDAQRDGDRILALIRGSAVNQNGRSGALTVPNGLAQERVITDALASARVAPADVQYLEAQGTGTPLGDPIEVQAAHAALSRGRDPANPLLIGSVKTNIGHSETAAGIAGVLKVILALQHERIPKNLHFHTPNPDIPWRQLNVRVVAEAVPWLSGGVRRIAGVSAFGFVGTNAHVVLEEPPARETPTELRDAPRERCTYLLALSAREDAALADLAGRYLDLIARDSDIALANVCHTANTGRDHFAQRAALVFSDSEQLKAQLTALKQRLNVAGLYRSRVAVRGQRRIAFMFTGQGSQFAGMGRELYAIEPVFREHFDRCAVQYERLVSGTPGLRQIVFEDDGKGRLDETAYTQPALYALEVSLIALLRSWGIEPDIVLGHSVGEYAAAYAAGVFSLEDGMALIAERGRLMQGLPSGGAMAAISANANTVEEALRARTELCVAAYNGAETVISGARDAVDEVLQRFEAEGVLCKRLATSGAFHSPWMDPILDDFKAFASRISYQPTHKRLVSNASGEVVAEGTVLDAAYWTTHIREPVQFERGVRALQLSGCDVVIELGPQPVLVGMGQRCWNAEQEPTWVGTLCRNRSDVQQMMGAAAQVYSCGVDIDFGAMDAAWHAARTRIALPFYPFQRERFWVSAPEPANKPKSPEIRDCLYRTAWIPTDAPSPAKTPRRPETWLVLADRGNVGATLCRQLEESGQRCVRLLPRNDDAAITAEMLAETIAAASSDESAPLTHVVHLCSLDQPHADDIDQLYQAQARGVESVLDLIHVLLERRWRGRLWLVTRGVQRIRESDSVATAQSPLWGFGKAISMEHPELWGGLVDLPLDGDAATGLLAVLESPDAEDQVALRDGQRWIARLERCDATRDQRHFAVNGNSTYLVTGGLGGVGLQVAGRLVERGARHLVLTSRRAPSESARETIANLERRGCNINVVLSDVALESEVNRVLDQIRDSKLPPLRGIVHAAGMDTVVPLHELDRPELRRTLAPKLAGAFLLDRLTTQRGLELSLFVCTSSIASVWGSVSQAAYSAANAFLDALAQKRHAQAQAATTINYGPWSGVGMAAANGEGVVWLHSRGIRPLDPASALDGMETAVAAGLVAAVVANVNWSIFRELAELQRQRPLLEKLGRTGTGEGAGTAPTAFVVRLTAAGPAERVELLKEIVKAELARVLRTSVEQIENNVGFFELGMDSLMAMEVTNGLRRCLGRRELSAQLLYERPTVDQLAAALSDSLNFDETSTAAAAEIRARDAGFEAGDRIEWPASLGQTRLWFLAQMAPTSPQFNLPIAVRFESEIRPELLERALRELMLRHEALRTTFEIRNGDLYQIVHKWLMPVLRVVDLVEHPHAETQLKKLQEEEARKLFDLVRGPLIRFVLVNLGARKHVLLMTVHHTISDGVSLRVLLDEFLTLHQMFGKDEQSPLPAPESQFGAYAVYERRQLGSRIVQDELAYWRQELRDIPPLDLPSDRVRPAVQSHAGDSVPVSLSAEMRDRVHDCSRLTGVTPFVTLLATWGLLLGRYSNQNDFGIGTPVAGRDGGEWSHVVGLFLNMLTLRVRLNEDWSAREFLTQVGTVVRRSLAHQALPFDWLVGQLNPARDPSRTPLFQAALVLQVPNHDFQARVDAARISLEDLQPVRNAAQFDITLSLAETSTGFRGFLEYNTDLFDRWRIEQMASHFGVLLSAMTSSLDTPISKLVMLPVDEHQRLLTAWNQSVRDYPMDRCVHGRVAEQARRRPRRIAVVCGDKRLTYRELNRSANQLAHYLRRRGVGPNIRVALCLDRSADMIVGMLGVMKAGGAYVPLDPDFPKHRLEQMLEDAKVAVLVSQTALRDRLPKLDAETVWLDRDGDGIAMESDRDPKHVVDVQDSAYVIYTSGSTGKPKGVVICHRSLLNLLMSIAEETAFTSQEVMVAVTTISFDISGLELLLPLLQGARTVIATLEETRDIQRLRRVLHDSEATIMQATPATWRMLLTSGWTNPEGIRVLCGGEALRQDLAKGLLNVTDFLWNVYGPTETTIWSAIHRVRDADRPTVSLGKPLGNTQLHILDEYLQPVPLGVPGELFIGGAGVAKGYLNQPELTAERFIPDPFAERPGARLYRTGDLCQRLPDGNIEFLGRRDHQVKVRGYRIEFGDIEAALARCPGIRQAAVTTWKGPDGFDFLAGYLVADQDQRPALDALKDFLRDTLPAYMIPGMFMFVDELPLTPNKKVDRRALPSPEFVREQTQNEFVAPRTDAEKALAEVWKEVLGVERVGIRDNFFDVGGHSLLIVQVMSKLKQHYDIELSIADLYQHATVESLANYLECRTDATDRSAASDATPLAAGGHPMRDETRHHRTKDGMQYVARRYREGDKAGAIASFAEAFGPGPASVLNAVFDWKYLEHPLAPADDPAVIVLECDGHIVGMDGGVRARFKIEEETMPGFWSTDTHLAPDHRAVTGWALATGMRHSTGITFGMPNANSYPILSATRAVVDVDRFADLKACLDLGPVMKTRGFSSLLSLICGALFSPVPPAFGLYSSVRAGNGVTVTQTPRFDGRIDALWRTASRDYPGIMVRDHAFLSWRFDRCPNRNYTRYVAQRDGAIVGYMVTRETRWQGARRGRIIDFLVGRNDSAVFDSLVRAVMQDFRSRGAVSVTCSVSSTQTEHIRRLRRHGFLYSKAGARIVVNREPNEAKLAAIDNWFFTFADGDADYNEEEGET